MLGKLIKHELYALSRILLAIHGLLILFSFIGRLLLGFGVLDRFPNFISATLVSVYLLTIFVVLVVTQLMVAVRFYKNLYTDEGYLSFTLPVSPASHLHAKWIASAIWIAIDFVVILLSFAIVLLNADSSKAFTSLLSSAQFFSFSEAVYTVIIYVLSVILGPILIFFCISLGQLFGSHRILGAVVVYFLVTALQQIIVMIVLFIDFPRNGLEVTASFEYLFQFIIIFSLVECIIFYLSSRYVMTKHTNLN